MTFVVTGQVIVSCWSRVSVVALTVTTADVKVATRDPIYVTAPLLIT